jgi:O-antigen/teichoic acid export membrane protein
MLQQNSITTPKVPLRKRVLNAGVWSLVSYAADISAKFISNLIITRLLFPEAFGLMAAAMALIVSLVLISDVGVRTIIIQRAHGETPAFLHSAWTFQWIRGAILFAILNVLCSLLFLPQVRDALPSGTVFADPLFPWVVIALGLTLLFGGFESTAASLNIRLLNFRPSVVAEILSRLVSLPVTVAFAYFYHSVWPLVLGTIAGTVAKVLLSHTIIPGPAMRISFCRDHFREIIAFGKWINLSSLATFVVSQSNLLVLGVLVPAPILGIYYIAKSLADTVEGLLERLNSSLTLSVLGEVLRHNPTDLHRQYYRFRAPLELVAFTSAGFIFTAGDWIVNLLYDPRYASAGAFLRILSVGLLLYPFQLIRSAFTAAGRPQVVAFGTLVHAASLAICLPLGYYFYGPVGAVAGITSSRLFPSIFLIGCAFRHSWVSVWREILFLPTFFLGALGGSITSKLFASLTLSNLRHLLW